MYRRREITILILLFFAISTAGCLADATPETTYKSQTSDCYITLTGDGIPDKNSELDDTYIWKSPDGLDRGYWYKMDNTIYLEMNILNDLPLDVDGNSLFWPNGAEWTRS